MTDKTTQPPADLTAESTAESADASRDQGHVATNIDAEETTAHRAASDADIEDVTLDAISTPPMMAASDGDDGDAQTEIDASDAIESESGIPAFASTSDPAADDAAEAFRDETLIEDPTDTPANVDAPPAALQEAGERASRRVRNGWRMTSSFGAAIAAAAVLPPLAILASFVAYPAATPPTLPTPPTVDLAAVTTSLDAAEGAAKAATARERDLLSQVLRAQATQSAETIGRAIAVAREARRKDGKKGAQLATAFSAEELSTLPARLDESGADGRTVLHRDGTRLFGDVELPAALAKSETPSGEDRAEEIQDGRLFIRVCVANEKTCVVESAPLELSPIAVADGRRAIEETTKSIGAFTASLDQGAAVPQSEHIEERRLWTAAIALLLAMLAAGFIVRALARKVAAPLAAASQRALLLTQGRDQPRNDDGVREVADMHAALDAVAVALEKQRQEMEAADVKRERLTHLADTLDAIARGETSARAQVAGSVTEQSLTTAANRLADALERHATRLASHLDALSSSKDAKPVDLQKRVSALKPLPPLMADIGQRLAALANNANVDETMKRDLVRLGEAVRARAKTATALYQALESAVVAGGGQADAAALERLREDLRLFSAAPAFPTLLFSLATGPTPLDAAQISARLRPAPDENATA